MEWENLPENYTDAVWSGLKRYSQINNEDGTVSFQDVTIYSNKENSFFGAKDANAMNGAMNKIAKIIDQVPVENGGTGAKDMHAARYNLGMNKTLWSGSWSKGTITVPDTDKYSVFRIAMSGEGTTILVNKYGENIRGGTSFPKSASAAVQYHFAATFSGTTWTFGFCTKNNVGSTTFDTNTVISIVGLL